MLKLLFLKLLVGGMLTKVTPTRQCSSCLQDVSMYRECSICQSGIICVACVGDRHMCMVCEHIDTNFIETRMCISQRKMASTCLQRHVRKILFSALSVPIITVIGYCANLILKREEHVVIHFGTGLAFVLFVTVLFSVLIVCFKTSNKANSRCCKRCCKKRNSKIFSNVLIVG